MIFVNNHMERCMPLNMHNSNLKFYPSVRAYSRNGRVYFINTKLGTWASIPYHYARAIRNELLSFEHSQVFDEAYDALAKAMIIRDLQYHKNISTRDTLPLMVKIRTTGKCNLKCSYCFNDLSARNRCMNKETIKRAIDYSFSNPYAVNGVHFCIYGGEPFMDRDLLYMTLSYIFEKGKNATSLRVSINTNGTLLTDEDIQYIKEHKIQLSVSFDGLLQFHDQYRKGVMGNKTGEIVLNTIEKLKGYENFSILTSITQEMSDRLLDIALFMEDKGFPSVEFQPIHMLGCAEGKKKYTVNAADYASSLKALVIAIEEGKIKNLKIRTIIRLLLALETGQTLYGEIGNRRCGSGRNSITIDYDGSILGCDMMPAKYSPVIGDVNCGINALEKLDALFLPYGHISPRCTACPWTLFCRSGCTGASGSDQSSCNMRHFTSCQINREIYPYLLEKIVSDGGKLHEYFVNHTTRIQNK